MNYVKYPYLNPIRFVKRRKEGIHFDDQWYWTAIRDFQLKIPYFQKWMKSETTPLFVESTIPPSDMIILYPDATQAKTIAWTVLFAGTTYSLYKLVWDTSDLNEGKYFAYQKFEQGELLFDMLSEPIWVKAKWTGTNSIIYKNSKNRFDVAFTTGVKFKFRCEYDILDYTPERDATDYTNQVSDKSLLIGMPIKKFKFNLGNVAPYVLDLCNRIFCCDYVLLSGEQYVAPTGSKWEYAQQKGTPLVLGAKIEIVPAFNMTSLEFADTTPLAPGLIIAYNFDASPFSGTETIVPILEFENVY